jgi:hypothetical protein
MRSLAALALLFSACAVVPDQRPPGGDPQPPPEAMPSPPARPAPPPPVPPPPPRPMTAREALDHATAFCRERGYDCRHPSVERLGNYWRVRFEASGAQREGLLYLDLDATSRAIVRADEPPVRPPPPPPPPRPAPVVVVPPPAPAPPPVYAPPPAPRPAPAHAAPQPMGRDEAVSRGLQACRDRGFSCDLIAAARHGDIWLVDYDARRGYLRGPLHLGFDAWTRDLIAFDEPRPQQPPPAPPPPRPLPPAPRPAPAPGPPPRPPPMRGDEASRFGLDYCRSRGWTCAVLDRDLVRHGRVWRLRLEALPPLRGQVRLEIDAQGRSLLEARDDVRRRGERDRD